MGCFWCKTNSKEREYVGWLNDESKFVSETAVIYRDTLESSAIQTETEPYMYEGAQTEDWHHGYDKEAQTEDWYHGHDKDIPTQRVEDLFVYKRRVANLNCMTEEDTQWFMLKKKRHFVSLFGHDLSQVDVSPVKDSKTDVYCDAQETETESESQLLFKRSLKRCRSNSLPSLPCLRSTKEDIKGEQDWFYKLKIQCGKHDIHLILNQTLETQYKSLAATVNQKGNTKLTFGCSMLKESFSAFEKIYMHMIDSKHLLMSECIKTNFDLAVRFLLARNITPTEMCEFLHESMKENRNAISKAIGWNITKECYKVILSSEVVNSVIDIWPGFRCRCDRHHWKGHSRICSTEPIIIVEVEKFSNSIPKDFYGIPIKQSFPELEDDQTIKQFAEEKTKLSPSSDNLLNTHVSISAEIAEMCFKKHSKLTMIYVHPLGKPIIQLFCQMNRVIPIGEQHFPKTINGVDTCIAEGHVRFMAKIQIGDSICRSGSFAAGTLGGFVQWNGLDAFLTCAHVVYDLQTLIAGNKRERHRSKTNIEFAKLPTKDASYPSSKTYAGFVVDSDFPDEDRVRTCGTSVDAAVVALQGDTYIDKNDILNDRTAVVKSMNFLGMKGPHPYLNDNYITPKALFGTVEAKYVGMSSGYVESNVTFEDYDKNDDKFKKKPHGLSLYFKDVKSHLQDIENGCPKPQEIPFEVYFQQVVVPKLDEKIRSGRHFFRFYNQLLLEQFSFEPGDSGTCIYVVEDQTIVRPDNQPNPTGCLAMAIASFYDSNEKRNKCIATPMQAILKTLNLI